MRFAAKNGLAVFGLGLAALCLAGSARAVEADKLTPADADLVVSVNVRKLVDSDLFKKYAKDDAEKALLDDNAKKMLEAVGLNPLKDVDTILFTNAGIDKAKRLVVIRGTFDVDKIKAAADAYAKDKPDDLKISKEDGLTIYQTKGDGKQTYYAHVVSDGKKVLASTDKAYLVQAIMSPSAGPSKELQDALNTLDGKDGVWMAMVVTDEMRKSMETNPQGKELAPKLKALTGTVDVANDVHTNLVIHTTDEKSAADVKKLLNQVKPILTLAANSDERVGPLVGDLMDNLKITTDKNSVNVNLTVTADLIEKASKAEKEDKDKKDSKDK
jgi:hypothetical protein